MHDFHSDDYVDRWISHVGGPLRDSVMRHLIAHLSLIDVEEFHVLELAPGPGILAQLILTSFPGVTYVGADYSEPMRRHATARIAEFSGRAQFVHADLRSDDWTEGIAHPLRVVLSMQALHDVGGEDAHDRLYSSVRGLMPAGGLLLNADYMKRSSRGGGGPGIPLDTHLGLLRKHAFQDVKCTLDIGRYACVSGTVPAAPSPQA
ncbi:MAG: class I SAM-dependent methyltransferase [Candidatus Poribacteria bacterium]